MGITRYRCPDQHLCQFPYPSNTSGPSGLPLISQLSDHAEYLRKKTGRLTSNSNAYCVIGEIDDASHELAKRQIEIFGRSFNFFRPS